MTASVDEGDPRLEQARNLFEFLKRAQQLKTKPVRQVRNYESVTWFVDLPAHDAVDVVSMGGEVDDDAPFVSIDRVPREEPPEPPAELEAWIELPIDDPTSRPPSRNECPRTSSRTWISV